MKYVVISILLVGMVAICMSVIMSIILISQSPTEKTEKTAEVVDGSLIAIDGTCHGQVSPNRPDLQHKAGGPANEWM